MTPTPNERFISTVCRQIKDGWIPMTAAVLISLALSGNAAAVILVAAALLLVWQLRGST
jgi:hypothetical protein